VRIKRINKQIYTSVVTRVKVSVVAHLNTLDEVISTATDIDDEKQILGISLMKISSEF
jgi:hypothetical protein